MVDTMGRAFFVREMNSAMSNFKEESREEVWRKIWNLDVLERVSVLRGCSPMTDC